MSLAMKKAGSPIEKIYEKMVAPVATQKAGEASLMMLSAKAPLGLLCCADWATSVATMRVTKAAQRAVTAGSPPVETKEKMAASLAALKAGEVSTEAVVAGASPVGVGEKMVTLIRPIAHHQILHHGT
jgi:hypothetical protein